MSNEEKIMNALLELYDWHVRMATLDADDYQFGYTDGIGQCILNIGDVLGEKSGKPYKYEAYKRVMQYDTTANYWKNHPKPVSSYFPADIIRKNGGKI